SIGQWIGQFQAVTPSYETQSIISNDPFLDDCTSIPGVDRTWTSAFFYFRSISSLFDSSDNVSNRRRRNLKASSDLSTSEASLEQEFNGRTMRRTFHSSAIWRIEIPTHHAQHSPSSGPLLPPGPPAHLLSSQPHGPPPPQPPSHRFRPPGQRPMAPHRAIAAGLNPADVVNASTPRPSYRMVPNQQPQHPQYYPPAPATLLYHQSPVPRRQNVCTTSSAYVGWRWRIDTA
uniref:Uncharacterized protein n=1 Tax=Caenorhabditis japonica TaxID=281687 RepID=A0A8R1EXP0_CAEJA